LHKAKALGLKLTNIHEFLTDLFQYDLHAQRVYSLANGALGVIASGSLAIHAMGHGLAQARGLVSKHAIKQIDRLLSNPGIDVAHCFTYWVPQLIGQRQEVLVALDWTDFEADGQTTIALHLITGHGRATPLLWKTVQKSTLKHHRNDYEDELLQRFKDVVPAGVKVTVLADRGFGDHKLFEFLQESLGFDYVIRIRGNIGVTSADGECRPAADWVGVNGRAKTLRQARVTAEEFAVSTVVCVKAKAMKEPWCLVASDPTALSRTLINHYAKRWTIEPGFRDTKDLHFGMGLSATHIKNPERRDRLLLLNAFAIVLLTLLGAAGESLGFDRLLKANTVKRRTHSLFRQGSLLYDLIPTMPESRLLPLIQRFGELLLQQSTFKHVFGLV
jgi:hypothetical protein